MEKWCAQAVLEVLDFMPVVPLYVVTKMKEIDREDMIIDKTPLNMPAKVNAYKKAVDEGTTSAAEAQLRAISHDATTTSLELVEEGSLPDLQTNRENRARFLDRSVNITIAATGDAPD